MIDLGPEGSPAEPEFGIGTGGTAGPTLAGLLDPGLVWSVACGLANSFGSTAGRISDPIIIAFVGRTVNDHPGTSTGEPLS